MYKRKLIINLPLLLGTVLSLALHGAALYTKNAYTPPMPAMEQGHTVVHLTLVPSMASQAAAPEPPAEKQIEKPLESPVPIPVPVSIPTPDPTPIVKSAEPSPVLESSAVESPEQDASLQEDKGVTAEASLTGAFRPPYPRISKLRGETGTITLSIQVRSDGSVGKVSMFQSSGYRRLDEAAMKAARKTTFTPATRFGQSIDSETELSFTFRLTDD